MPPSGGTFFSMGLSLRPPSAATIQELSSSPDYLLNLILTSTLQFHQHIQSADVVLTNGFESGTDLRISQMHLPE